MQLELPGLKMDWGEAEPSNESCFHTQKIFNKPAQLHLESCCTHQGDFSLVHSSKKKPQLVLHRQGSEMAFFQDTKYFFSPYPLVLYTSSFIDLHGLYVGKSISPATGLIPSSFEVVLN